jgi:hypothetical protein
MIDPQQLSIALQNLQQGFQLSDAQISCIPLFRAIRLKAQHDSHLVTFDDSKTRNAHPFKLFIDMQEIDEEDDKKPYACLFKLGKSPFQIFIMGANKSNYWLACNQTYYGSVKDVAFPYDELMATSKFIALVRFYFTLDHRVGLYTTNPGFTLSESWRQDLQNA